MFGCPYNLHPDKPWLRRTIRGVVATGVIAVSPILAAGAVTAAVVVLPSVGIYKLVRHIRARRTVRALNRSLVSEPILFNTLHDEFNQDPLFQFDFNGEDITAAELLRILRERFEARRLGQTNNETINEAFPLSVFADMDVEHLFLNDDDDDKSPSNFQTCPTTPSVIQRKGHSQSLRNLTSNNNITINRSVSFNLEH